MSTPSEEQNAAVEENDDASLNLARLIDDKHAKWYLGANLVNAAFGFAIFIYLSLSSLVYIILIAVCIGSLVGSILLFQKRLFYIRYLALFEIFGILLSSLLVLDFWPFWLVFSIMVLNMAAIIVDYMDIRKQDRRALNDLRIARQQSFQ